MKQINRKPKYMFEKTFSKEIESEKEVASKNDKGEEVTTKKKEKTQKEYVFSIKNPTRKILDDADLFYTIELSTLVKKGVLTKAMLSKRIANDNGLLSEKDHEDYVDSYKKLIDIQTELQILQVKDKKAKKEEEEIQKLLDKAKDVQKNIQTIESVYSELFDITAEKKAENKMLTWWLTNLLFFKEKDSKEEPSLVFGEGDFEEKMSVYDQIEEENDEFMIDCISTMMLFVSFWFQRLASTQEEFDKIYDKYKEQNTTQEEK